MKANKLVVTRHPALVDLLFERGIISQTLVCKRCGQECPQGWCVYDNGSEVDSTVVAVSPRVIAHATEDDVRGKHVIGVLPLALAALCASVTEIPLALQAHQRGRELTLEELREIAGKPVTYIVTRVLI